MLDLKIRDTAGEPSAARRLTRGTKPRKRRELANLSAAEFENLMFDLLAARGAGATWRTPGADGGRDIECIVASQDFSGARSVQRWFVECKRYTSSVDWPRIYEKLAYADSHRADALLMCTTGTFSVPATSRCESWNAQMRRPAIRLWPRHEIELQLVAHPDLRVKYGLSRPTNMPGKSMMTLALALSKAVSSHYSRLVFQHAEIDRMLAAAQAFADLLSRRMADLDQHGEGSMSQPFKLSDSLGEFIAEDRSVTLDECGLRAFVTYLASLSAEKIWLEAPSESTCHILSTASMAALIERYKPVFSAIAVWSNFDFKLYETSVVIEQRIRV